MIKSEIDKFKIGGEFENMFPERWLPSSFAILSEGFTEENKFLNSTLKMVRGKMKPFYSERIQSFEVNGKDIYSSENKNSFMKLK